MWLRASGSKYQVEMAHCKLVLLSTGTESYSVPQILELLLLKKYPLQSIGVRMRGNNFPMFLANILLK